MSLSFFQSWFDNLAKIEVALCSKYCSKPNSTVIPTIPVYNTSVHHGTLIVVLTIIGDALSIYDLS
jgi:hypothetical protein